MSIWIIPSEIRKGGGRRLEEEDDDDDDESGTGGRPSVVTEAERGRREVARGSTTVDTRKQMLLSPEGSRRKGNGWRE